MGGRAGKTAKSKNQTSNNLVGISKALHMMVMGVSAPISSYGGQSSTSMTQRSGCFGENSSKNTNVNINAMNNMFIDKSCTSRINSTEKGLTEA